MMQTPKGMRDFLPEDMIIREEVIDSIIKVYRKYGYVPLETPAMEYLKTLNSKQSGDEITGQIFKIEESELGLRFDLTVPLARVAATNAFTKPFKRYQIGRVWRREEPQKGRFRECGQADVDIIGCKSMRAEAEIISVARQAILSLGFKNPEVVLGSRKIMNAVSKKLGFEDKINNVLRVLDKLDKIGELEVKKQLNEIIGNEKTKKLFEMFVLKGNNKSKIESAKKIDEEGAKELEEIVKLCNFDIDINLTLVRGLGYYTGPVFEIRLGKEIGSVAGGGRYDTLMGLYGQNDCATGISLGIERLTFLLKEKKGKKTNTKVFVANVKPEFYSYALETAEKLRKEEINAEIDLNERNLRKQFDYANSLGIPYVIIVGEKEKRGKKVTLRDMNTGKEKFISLKDAVKKLTDY